MLFYLKVGISERKQIIQQKRSNLAGAQMKKMPKNLVTLPL